MLNLIALSEEFSLIRNPDQVVLESLFLIDDVRVGSVARKTIPLLVDLLRPIPDRPGAPPFAVRLLTQIADGNDANKLHMAEAGALDALSKYLSLSPQDLNEATISELLRILFSNPDLLRYEAAAICMDQLIAVLHLGSRSARLSAARALNELFDADNIRDSESSIQAIQPLADMLDTTSECEQQAALSALVKLTSDCNSRAAVLAEVEGNLLHSICKILSSASTWEMKSDAAELCCVLFDNPRVRELPIVSECIEPLILLMQSDKETAVESGVCAFERLLDDEKQWRFHQIMMLLHSALQALVNILEKPQSLSTLKLTPSQVIEPLISFLESPLQAIQQLGTELLSHLLEQEHFKQDITTKSAVPLVQLAGIGILNLQQTAIKALENISLSCQRQFVMLAVALNALTVQEKTEASSAELMVEAGAIDALLDLLRSHQCEEASVFARPTTKSQIGRLLAALALGDLSNMKGLPELLILFLHAEH
ncbi:UNVERIFIED_CONTAM: protein CELLULOSE SYNTHASE INTERACTIVE 3 [Sesamum radiatum]|uniref:Protein CELLULOSE SYNTHASE INTERACTIVE 3 n=1 Tax=Sesamum radiatum TaxID=300843 RepID=A0AAW2PXW8_SESRA